MKKAHGKQKSEQILIQAYKYRRNGVAFSVLTIIFGIIVLQISYSWGYYALSSPLWLIIVLAFILSLTGVFVCFKKYNDYQYQLSLRQAKGYTKYQTKQKINKSFKNNKKIIEEANKCRAKALAFGVPTFLIILITGLLGANGSAIGLGLLYWYFLVIPVLCILIPVSIYYIAKTVMFENDFGGKWPKSKQ